MITDDELRDGLRAIAAWGTPVTVPPPADAPVVDLDVERVRRHRRPTWWAAAAVLVTMAVMLGTLGSSSTPPPLATGTWTRIADAPIEPRALAASVWTGTEVVVVGGQSVLGEFLRDAAAYNPRTDTWRRLPDAPVDVHPGAVALWTGREVAVFNVESVATTEIRATSVVPPLADPIALDPTTGTWRTLPDPGDFVEAATVVGGRIVALAQRGSNRRVVLELAEERWAEVVALPPLTGDAFDFHLLRDWAGLTVGDRAVFIAQKWMLPGLSAMPVGFVVDLTGSVVEIDQPTLRAPGGDRSTVATSNVAAMGGNAVLMVALVVDDEGRQGHDAATYDVASRTWRRTKLPKELPPLDDVFAAVPMTTVGNDVLVVGGARHNSLVLEGQGGVHSTYVAEDRRWHRLPVPGIDVHRAAHTAVWTGTELVVWGGLYNRAGASDRLDTVAPDGAAYRP